MELAWEEPFGSGIVVDRSTEILAALELADRLNPNEIRAHVEEQFSPARMVTNYVAGYQRTIAHADHETAASPTRALTSA